MSGQRLAVADVHEAGEQLQGVQETFATRTAALHTEGEQAGGAAAHEPTGQRVVGMVLEACIVHPCHCRMRLEELRHGEGVAADAIHAQRQRFDALQDLPGIERRDGGAHVAQGYHTRTSDVGRRSECFGVDHTVVADIGLVQALEAGLVLRPGELAGINDCSTH